MDIKQLYIKDIDSSRSGYMRYLSDSVRDLDNVMDSINKVGLINPVVVKKTPCGNKSYTIVCGHKRLRAFKEAGVEMIDARIVDSATDEELLLMSFYDNLFCRELSDMEKAVIIKNFEGIGYTKNRLLSEILPHLQVPQNEKILDKYLSIFKLGAEVLDSIARQELEIEKAFILLPLEKEECDSVYKVLFKESKVNLNEARETVRNLLDLKQIRQSRIPVLLETDEIKSILRGKSTNERQKGECLYQLVKGMRYPTINEKEEAFATAIKELAFDRNIRINHSRFFESDEVQITIKVSDEEHLECCLDKLRTQVRVGAFKKILIGNSNKVNVEI
ncbi:MAG: ParB/RepB/Spo0J family partition protein [Planctomycetes bacterium]|nr:ParB/RepB/Spo0J family partition protein [Planctomycetota bacterium]